MVKRKAEVGDIVFLKGNTANLMNFKVGIVRRIGKSDSGRSIYYVSRMNNIFTTPFMVDNITLKRRKR